MLSAAYDSIIQEKETCDSELNLTRLLTIQELLQKYTTMKRYLGMRWTTKIVKSLWKGANLAEKSKWINSREMILRKIILFNS